MFLLCITGWRSLLVCDLEQKNVTWNASHKSTYQLFLTYLIFSMHQLLKLWWCSPFYSIDVTHKMSLLHSSLTRCPTSPHPTLLCTRDLSEEKALANLVSRDWVSETSSQLQKSRLLLYFFPLQQLSSSLKYTSVSRNKSVWMGFY